MMISVTFLEEPRLQKTHLQHICDEPISTSTSSPNLLFETNEGPDLIIFFTVGVGMAILACQLDYTWNKLKPKWQAHL